MKRKEFYTMTSFINENGMHCILTIERDAKVKFKREDLTKVGSVEMKDVHDMFDINFGFPEGLTIKATKDGSMTDFEFIQIHSHLMMANEIWGYFRRKEEGTMF